MFLSSLLFFTRSLTTAVLRDFGKLPERIEAFTTSRRSASKLFNTLLEKKSGDCVNGTDWCFKVLYCFFQNCTINFFEIRHSNLLRMWSDLTDLSATQGYADHLSDIIDFLREGSKLTALAFWVFYLEFGLGCLLDSRVAKRVCVLFMFKGVFFWFVFWEESLSSFTWFHIESINAVFIDVLMDYTFCFPY